MELINAPNMDVVGGVIVAAGDHEDDRRGACRGRLKRGRCGSDHGSETETMREEPSSWSSCRRRRKQGTTGGPSVDLHGDLRSVLTYASKISCLPPALAKPTSPPSAVAAVPFMRSWVNPLCFLLKKELTVTDVGDLGRIILPKRDAECQLPHLDNKEGQLLSMEDYNSNKNWTLRYKWWPNNKSRMYVLENTGEFVKYHDLKEKDELILYKDGVGNLVIRGQKWSTPPLKTDTSSDGGSINLTMTPTTGKRSPKGAHRRSSLLSKSGSSSSTMTSPCSVSLATATTTSSSGASLQLSTSLLTTSVLSTSSIFTTTSCSSYVEASLPNPPTVVGPYDAVVLQPSDHMCIDWAKLPDPPAIEFSDPPAIEFPDEFECTWEACI